MLDFIQEIAEEAGKLSIVRYDSLQTEGVEFKSDKDLVTAVDREVEELLVRRIRDRFPEHGIFGEETGKSKLDSDYCWVIDPIDGTTSFVHGQPFYSISIAFQHHQETVAAVVFAPRLNELYKAEKGAGAYGNNQRLHVSRRQPLINAVLSTGFACIRADWEDNNLPYFCRIVPKLRGIRRFGSAAIDLSYVAAGKLEGFWEMNLKPYDIAAGVLILEEAGGRITDFQGGNQYPDEGIVATNGLIHDDLLDCFR